MKNFVSQNMQIAKYIARCGLCSRREADSWINMGRVSVNGQQILSPTVRVTSDCVVCVDNKPLAMEASRLFLHYKRPNVLTTHLADPKKRATLGEVLNSVDNLPQFLMPVGRLDFLSEGLLLLSNDGDLTRYLELPSSRFVRVYEVIVNSPVDEEALTQLSAPEGIVVDGWRYEPMKVDIKRKGRDSSVLTVSITEGKNREIRRVFASIGLKVKKLIRVAFGPYTLKELLPGDIQEVSIKPSLLNEAKQSSSLVKPASGERTRRRTRFRNAGRKPSIHEQKEHKQKENVE